MHLLNVGTNISFDFFFLIFKVFFLPTLLLATELIYIFTFIWQLYSKKKKEIKYKKMYDKSVFINPLAKKKISFFSIIIVYTFLKNINTNQFQIQYERIISVHTYIYHMYRFRLQFMFKTYTISTIFYFISLHLLFKGLSFPILLLNFLFLISS